MRIRFGNEAEKYDVIVCGAGHAGCEAALAAARMGADVLMLTGNLDTIAQMSCNPAIGGQAKGQIVREIDALGGEMAINTDFTTIQSRLLNTSKGPAVQAPRAQCDKKAYQLRMKHVLELQDNLSIFQAIGEDLIVKNGVCQGVKTNLGVEFFSKTVVLTAGTFLRSVMHVGSNKNEGGRMGDHSSKGLSKSMEDHGIKLERLKTGTPPRILGGSIDFEGLEEQKGDVDPTFFAFYGTRENYYRDGMFHVEHLEKDVGVGWVPGTQERSCWMTYTNSKVANVINENLHLSPMYSGIIEGTGPRYCPSIEDKIVRFKEKAEHRLFLEPEGINTDEWYINGLSTSLPLEIQALILREIPGLENAVITRPAYAVEYDFAPPTQLYPSLESKVIGSLFTAGQTNGTSGYEEAACQGLIAGINAVNKVRGDLALVLGRDKAYTGVLIDDLVTKGTHEPYRMFTSRAEHRLLLNHESSESRLFEYSKQYGLIKGQRLESIENKIVSIEEWRGKFESTRPEGFEGKTIGDLIRSVGSLPIDMGKILPNEFSDLDKSIRDEVFYKVQYRGYLEREVKQVKKLKNIDNIKIPVGFAYEGISGLRNESIEKLTEINPQTLGQASRISGINPSDIGILQVMIQAWQKKQKS